MQSLLHLRFDGLYNLANYVEAFNEWLSHIETNREKFAVEGVPDSDKDPYIGKLAIRYEDKVLFYVNIHRRFSSLSKEKVASAAFTLVAYNESALLLNPGEMKTIDIDDQLEYFKDGKRTNIVPSLQNLLPIRREDEVHKIEEVLGVDGKHIKMDTYNKWYIIDTPFHELKWHQKSAPTFFYKYMSLSAFFETMKNKSFRMHSIASQSDTTESFYLGDFMCDEYEDEMKRFQGMLTQKEVLISSFTESDDDDYMWENYAGNGKGVCLEFQMRGDNMLRQVQYIDQNRSKLGQYRDAIQTLKSEGIRVHFSAIDDTRRFVKDKRFSKEHEWRLVKEFDGDVDFALYSDRIVCYHDFEFTGPDLKDLGLRLVSITVGSNQPKGTSNFSYIVEMAHRAFGSDVIVNRR
jgi:hypothetical protein